MPDLQNPWQKCHRGSIDRLRSIHRPRRSRASPLWQIVHHAWGEFRRGYEDRHRRSCGPLRDAAVAVVEKFRRCGDLSVGFHHHTSKPWAALRLLKTPPPLIN